MEENEPICIEPIKKVAKLEDITDTSKPSTSDSNSSDDELTLHGLSARQHAIYGIDMMVLQLLRAGKQKKHRFYLAANISGLGSFGHLLVANVSCTGMLDIFLVSMHVQHNIPISSSVLRRACQVYRKLKRTLHLREDLNFLSKSPKDFRFVIYSTAAIAENFPSLSYTNEGDTRFTMLNTSSSRPLCLRDVSALLEAFVTDAELYPELEVIVLPKQADMDELEKILLAEIENLGFSRSAYVRHFMLLRLKNQVKDWWKEKNQYLTEDDVQQLIDEAWRYTTKTFAKNADEVCRRECTALQERLESCLNSKCNMLLLECSPGSESLVGLLLKQMLGDRVLMVKTYNLQSNTDEIFAMWKEILLVLEQEQNTSCSLEGLYSLCEELKTAVFSSNRRLVLVSSPIANRLSTELLTKLTDDDFCVCHVYKRVDFDKYMEHFEREVSQKVNDNFYQTTEQQSAQFSQKIQTLMKEFNNVVPLEGSGEENMNVLAVKEQLLKEIFTLMRQRAENRLQDKLRDEIVSVLTEMGHRLFQIGISVQPIPGNSLTFHKPTTNDGFGAKLAALIFLRCMAGQRYFRLAAKMSAAGGFGDLVARVSSTGEEVGTSRTLLIQLRYQMQATRLHVALDMQRIYSSYCTLKANWARSKDLQAFGEFNECILVVYTNQIQNMPCYHHLDKEVALLNMDGNCFTITEETFPEIYQEWKAHKEFLAQLWFLTDQAELKHLNKMLEREVNGLLAATTTKSQEITLEIENSFCNWWLLSNNFCTPEALFWSKITMPLVLNLSVVGNKQLETLPRVHFKKQHLQALKAFLINSSGYVHIATKSPLLSTMKVLQVIGETSHILLTSDSFLAQQEMVYALWKLPAGGFSHLVLMLLGSVDTNSVAIELLKRKEIPKNGIVIVVSVEHVLLNSETTLEYKDYTKLIYLEAFYFNKVMNSKVCFQGNDVFLGDILKFSNFPIESLGEEILQEILVGQRIHIGNSLAGSMKELHLPYIPRSLSSSEVTMRVTDIWTYPKKWVTILGEPGSGKTIYLNQVAKMIKVVSPYTWVIITAFKDFISVRRSQDVLMTKASTHKDKLCGSLLSHELHSNGNVVLLIDGIDEVELDCIDRGLQTLKLLKDELLLSKAFIFIQPTLKEKFEMSISVTSLQLLPFTIEEQKLFLVKFWEKHTPCETLNNFATELLELIQKVIPDPHRHLTGTPFFMYLLAELYQEKTKSSKALLDIFQICKLFLSRRLELCVQKKIANTIFDLFQTERFHTYYALKTFRNFPQIKGIPKGHERKFLQSVKCGLNPFGVVNEKNEQIIFVHDVFKQYYAGLWFGEHYNAFREFLEINMFEQEFQAIRGMMDHFLCQHFELHTAVILEDIEQVKSLCCHNINTQDWGGRTALHLVRNKAIARILLDHEARMDLQDNVLSWTPVQYVKWLKDI